MDGFDLLFKDSDVNTLFVDNLSYKNSEKVWDENELCSYHQFHFLFIYVVVKLPLSLSQLR